MTVLGHGYDDNVGAPAFRNVIINGGMNVWQRSTSSTTLGYATADRWWVNNGGGTTTIAREATIVPSKFQYAMKWTQATTANVVGIQAIESINCAHLVGQTVTITGYFAASASTSFTIDLLSSTSIDVAPASFSTSITPTSGGSGTVSSTTYVRVSGVYMVPSNVKSLAVRINATSLTNGTSFYFTGVQLEAGPVATPFEFEPFETTLRKCQRYYYDSIGQIRVYNTQAYTYWLGPLIHPVEMRAIPTVSSWHTKGGTANEYDPDGGGVTRTTAVSAGSNTRRTAAIYATAATRHGLLYYEANAEL